MKVDTKLSRAYTCKLLEMVDGGMIDKDTLIEDLLNFLSEAEVKQFCDLYIDMGEDDEE